MRKYDDYRDSAREMTAGLCFALLVAVVGTIVLSAIAVAALTVAITYGYLLEYTTIEMPIEHWQNMFTERLVQAGIATLVVVLGTAIYRTWQLAEGGGQWLARSLGGTRVIPDSPDPAHVKLRNVVEELAIATGLRTPAVYVLEDEPGINAFAAGLDIKDSVIGVTRGAIDKLKRNQLQGVIAHEFSHIANGDMRLNLRLLGILSGVEAIAASARYLLRLGVGGSSSGTSGGGGNQPLGMVLSLVFGVVLWPIGQIGALFAKLIHLAVNRQREFLADASAVQYTRDPQALCEALRVLLEEPDGSRIRGPGGAFASHMFFASAKGKWRQLLEAHPPLQDRIRRLEADGKGAGGFVSKDSGPGRLAEDQPRALNPSF